MGALGSDDAGGTVSDSGGAEATLDAGNGKAAADVAEEALDPERSKGATMSRSSTAGRARERDAQ